MRGGGCIRGERGYIENCWVGELKERGYLRGYKGDINLKMIGLETSGGTLNFQNRGMGNNKYVWRGCSCF